MISKKLLVAMAVLTALAAGPVLAQTEETPAGTEGAMSSEQNPGTDSGTKSTKSKKHHRMHKKHKNKKRGSYGENGMEATTTGQ
ncbi:MAG: hypothetical protein AB7H77_06570 [Bdellovibrionales bacterium]